MTCRLGCDDKNRVLWDMNEKIFHSIALIHRVGLYIITRPFALISLKFSHGLIPFSLELMAPHPHSFDELEVTNDGKGA